MRLLKPVLKQRQDQADNLLWCIPVLQQSVAKLTVRAVSLAIHAAIGVPGAGVEASGSHFQLTRLFNDYRGN